MRIQHEHTPRAVGTLSIWSFQWQLYRYKRPSSCSCLHNSLVVTTTAHVCRILQIDCLFLPAESSRILLELSDQDRNYDWRLDQMKHNLDALPTECRIVIGHLGRDCIVAQSMSEPYKSRACSKAFAWLITSILNITA